MKIEQIAELCYEVNRVICSIDSDDPKARPSWSTATAETKGSVRQGVFEQFNALNITPEESHKRWMKNKEAEGWVYGETLDIELKVHPNLRPYDELSSIQQLKDYVFLAIVTICKGFSMSPE